MDLQYALSFILKVSGLVSMTRGALLSEGIWNLFGHMEKIHPESGSQTVGYKSQANPTDPLASNSRLVTSTTRKA